MALLLVQSALLIASLVSPVATRAIEPVADPSASGAEQRQEPAADPVPQRPATEPAPSPTPEPLATPDATASPDASATPAPSADATSDPSIPPSDAPPTPTPAAPSASPVPSPSAAPTPGPKAAGASTPTPAAASGLVEQAIGSGAVTTALGTTTITISQPSSTSPGDLLFASIAYDGGTGTTFSTVPTGWTLARAVTNNGTSNGIATYWHLAGTSEPASYAWTATAGARLAGGIIRYTGVDPTSPIHVTSTNSGTSTTASASTVTTTMANARLVVVISRDDRLVLPAVLGSPAGMTGRIDLSNDGGSATEGPAVSVSDLVLGAAGATGARSITLSSSDAWVAQQVTLRPDITAPVATIDLQAGSDSGSSATDNLTNAASLTFDVTFTEPVTGLAAGDFSNAGTATGCTVGAPTGSVATYTVTLTGCSEGTVILRLAASGVTDGGGNGNALTNGPTVTVDRTAPATPTVNLVPAFVNLANRTAVSTTVTGEVGATAAGSVTDGTTSVAIAGTVPAGGTLTVTPNLTTLADGTVTAAATLTDPAGNTSSAGSDTATKDTVAPTVTINQAAGQADPTNVTPINYTVVFSEPVTGFATGDVTVGGSSGGTKTGTVTGGTSTFNVAVTGMTSSGTVTATIAASVATDAAGNNNAASTTSDNAVTWDVTAPSVTINQATGQADPTGTSPILYTVTFNEAVTGFATGDVTFAGTAGGTKVGTVTGGPTIYTVSVTGMSTTGTVIASIAAGVATDAAGNGNAGSTSTDATVTWDVTSPSVTINQASGQADPTNGSTITFTVVFSETVTGFATGDVTIGGTAGGTLTGTVSGGPATYTVAVTGMTSAGTVIPTINAGVAADLAGNANLASTSTDNSVTWDNVAPTVVLTLRSTSDSGVSNSDRITNVASPVFDATFSESVTAVALADFTTTGSTATGCTIGSLSGSGATRSVTLTGCSGGTVQLNFVANGATDLAGNTGPAATSSVTITIDRTAPTVTINQAAGQADPTNASPINYTATFSEPVANFATGDVSFAGTAGGTKVGTVTGGTSVFNVATAGMTTSGTVIASIAANVATDIAGNNNTASTATDATVTWDVVVPVATLTLQAGSDTGTSSSDRITNAASLTFNVTFTESVTGLTAAGLTNVGTATGCVVGTPGGSGTAWTVTLTSCSEGTVILRLAAGAATDAATNPVAQTDSLTVTVDRTSPAVTINQGGTQADPTRTSPILYTAVFSEAVSGFATGDVTFTGTAGGTKTGTVTLGPTTFTVSTAGMTTTGTVIASIAAGVATDTAGNGNAASTSTDNTVTWDVTAPTVTINQAAGQADPTNASPILYTVTFSEPVTGFVTGDVTFTGTAGGTKVGTVTGGPTMYTVSVTGMSTSGTVIASLAANVATDLAGNNSAASTSTDNTVTWDVTPPATPTVNIVPAFVNIANRTAVQITISGEVGTSVALSVTDGTTSMPISGTIPAGGTLTVNPNLTSLADGTVTASATLTDAAGNTSGTGSDTATKDTVAPTVTINQASGQADPTNASPIAFTAVFSEPVSGFATGDVSVGGTSGGTKTGTVSGGPTTFNVAVTGMTTSGTVVATIAASAATDTAGNPSLASTSTDNTVTWNRATHLGFVQGPTSTVYGSVIAPAVTVAVLDAGGLVVTESGDTVSLALGAPGPTLVGTTSATVVNGIATFSDLRIDQVGSYTLAASAAGLTGATSAAFSITPAPLTITADDRTKTYGDVVSFAGTEFTATGLVLADGVTSVTLASTGAVATASVAGSPYAIVPGAAVGSGLANYAISYVNGALTVDPATASIAVTGYSVTYDGLPHTATGTATGVLGEDLSAGLDLSATTHTAVGSFTDAWSFDDPAGNYLSDSGTVDNEITQAAVTITADGRTKTYGDAVTFAGTEFTATGLVGGDTVTSVTLASPGAAAAATVAGSPYPIVASGAVGTGLGNYAISYVDGALTVDPAALTITADDRTKTYGQTVTFAGTEFTTSGLVNADAVDSVTLTSSGAAATATVVGSPYPIVASGAVGTGLGNYAIGYVDGLLTVGQAPLTITADDRTKVYGEAVVFLGTELTTSGLLNADSVTGVTLTSAGAPATAQVAGSPYAIVASGAVGIGLGNYAITYVDGMLTVTPAPLTITADDATKTYGQAVVFDGTEFTAAGLLNADAVDTVTLTSAGAPATAPVAGSPYAIAASAAVGTGLGNYAISYVDGMLTVLAAPLTITADDATKTYGQTVAFAGTEFTAVGLQNADTVATVTLASAGAPATAQVAGSPYAITASAAVGTGLANYAISYVDGTLTVLAAPLTITADDATKVYGATLTFAGTEFTTAGLVNGDTVAAVTLASAGAPATAAVGSYPIAPSAATGSGLANYAIIYVDGTLTVTPAPLTITADDATKTYGATLTFAGTEFTTVGLVNADTVDGTTLTSAGAVATAAVGTYPITPSAAVGTGLANYAISYVDGTLTVGHAALTITADDRVKTYGQAVTFAGTEFGVTGLLNADAVDSVSLVGAGAPATAAVGGSPYAIVASAALGTGLGNYAITYVDGTLTVGLAPLTITADDQSKPFGVTFVFAGTELTTAGLLNADSVDSATLTSAGAPAMAAPNTYPIVVSAAVGTGLANYAITYVDGFMAVGNTIPAVGDASVTTGATSPVSGAVTLVDPDTGQSLTVTISADPANGTATVANDGSFTYTPTGMFTGNDTFAIQACDDAAAPACATGTVSVAVYPVAVPDDSVTVDGGTVEVDVQANDLGDTGDLTIVGQPAHGTARVGSIIYTADRGFVGTDHVVYRVCSVNNPQLCDDGTLTITVAEAPLPPTDADAPGEAPIVSVPGLTGLLVGALLLLTFLVGAAVAAGRRRGTRA